MEIRLKTSCLWRVLQFEGQSAELIECREKNQQTLDDRRATALKMDILEK